VPVDVATWTQAGGLGSRQVAIAPSKEAIDLTRDFMVDTRTLGEYDASVNNKTKGNNYGVPRDGHVEGAVSFPFADYFDSSTSCLKPCADFKSALTSRGWCEGKSIVAYCTGGIRSGFFFSVAAHCGVDAANYGGSMWDWAAGSSDKFKMTITPTVVQPANCAAASSSTSTGGAASGGATSGNSSSNATTTQAAGTASTGETTTSGASSALNGAMVMLALLSSEF